MESLQNGYSRREFEVKNCFVYSHKVSYIPLIFLGIYNIYRQMTNPIDGKHIQISLIYATLSSFFTNLLVCYILFDNSGEGQIMIYDRAHP